MPEVTVTPYNFGADVPNDPVNIPAKAIALVYQTVRDDNIFDNIYHGTLLTRIIKPGLEVLTQEALRDVLAQWAANSELNLVKFHRLATSYPGDDTTVCVKADAVTDVRRIPEGVYEKGYNTLIVLGGIRIVVTEELAAVKAALGH